MADRFKHRGERIKHYREAAGLSQKALAALIGIKSPSLSEIETGETKAPAALTLLRVAQVLGIDPLHLLTGEGSPVRAVQQLRESEVRLLLMFRELSPARQLELETRANELHATEHPVKSRANPYPSASPKVKATT